MPKGYCKDCDSVNVNLVPIVDTEAGVDLGEHWLCWECFKVWEPTKDE